MSSKDKTWSFQLWYDLNREDLNEQRRERYKTDPKYRDKSIKRNRNARKRERQETYEERQLQLYARILHTSQRWREVHDAIDSVTGDPVGEPCVTVGLLSDVLGCSIQSIRLWEKKGLEQKTTLRSPKGDRVYTAALIREIRRGLHEKGIIDLEGKRILMRRKKKWQLYAVKDSNGQEQHLRLYPVEWAAEIVMVAPSGIVDLEKTGRFPKTTLRTDRGHRLYSFEMLVALHDGQAPRDIEDVRLRWQELGMAGAEIIRRIS